MKLVITVLFISFLAACGNILTNKNLSSSGLSQAGNYIRNVKRIDDQVVELIVVSDETLYKSSVEGLENEFSRFVRDYARDNKCPDDRAFDITVSIGESGYISTQRIYKGKLNCLAPSVPDAFSAPAH